MVGEQFINVNPLRVAVRVGVDFTLSILVCKKNKQFAGVSLSLIIMHAIYVCRENMKQLSHTILTVKHTHKTHHTHKIKLLLLIIIIMFINNYGYTSK